MNMRNPTKEYVDFICRLYGDAYDDRKEDSRPGGINWQPGVRAAHRSIASFQRDLLEVHGISLSRSKVQKILITGGCWSTERSREVQRLFDDYTSPVSEGGQGLSSVNAIRAIAALLGISTVSVSINLPYQKTIYDLDEKQQTQSELSAGGRKMNFEFNCFIISIKTSLHSNFLASVSENTHNKIISRLNSVNDYGFNTLCFIHRA